MDAQTSTRPQVYGIGLDAATRCVHYHSERDIIAIRMACCGRYFACRECHDALADHAAIVWPQEQWTERAILCGACGYELSIQEYMACGYQCPGCAAEFNPGCRNHTHLYFEANSG